MPGVRTEGTVRQVRFGIGASYCSLSIEESVVRHVLLISAAMALVRLPEGNKEKKGFIILVCNCAL